MHGSDYKYPMSVTKALKLAGLIDVSHSSQEAMDRGTAIHAACEYWDQDDLDVTGMPEFIRPYLDGWIKFRKEFPCQIEAVEKQIDHDTYHYSGRVDRIVRTDSRFCILDIKSGQPAPWHALQSAAYAAAVAKQSGEVVGKRLAVYLNDDGSYKLVEHTDRTDWNVFAAALAVANWKRNHNLEG
jgi:ATP-dependent exoDNAse (exonuclease V) beta subunit